MNTFNLLIVAVSVIALAIVAYKIAVWDGRNIKHPEHDDKAN